MKTSLRFWSRACAVVVLALLAGCKTQSSLTAKAMQCPKGDVAVVPSAYSREGSTTVWCATCNDKLYQCVSNADRDRVVCMEAAAESRCR